MNAGSSQRSAASASAAAVLQHFDAALRDAATPPPPLSMTQLSAVFEAWNAVGGQRAPLPESLGALRQALFSAPGRDEDMRQLWRSSLATASGTWQLALGTAVSPAAAALGGLLHRAGAARLFAIVAAQEADCGQALHAALRRQLAAAHEATLRDALLQAWEVPPEAARASREWRAAIDDAATASAARLVYLAQLLASEALQPQFCAPAQANGVAARFSIGADRLQAARLAVSFLV